MPPQSARTLALVREQPHAEMYLAWGGARLLISSAGELAALGLETSQVQVVPDGTLQGLHTLPLAGPAPTQASDVFFDCGPGESWPFGLVGWFTTCKSSASIVKRHVLVAGWITRDTDANKATPFANYNDQGVEDIHYELTLDLDFLAQLYGPGGLNTQLAQALAIGNPPRLMLPAVPFADQTPDGQSRGVTINSFFLPGAKESLHVELNCWQVNSTNAAAAHNWIGRGPAPAGWFQFPIQSFTDCWFPYHPFDPTLSGTPLVMGDYLLMRGTLWIDTSHADKGAPDDWNH